MTLTLAHLDANGTDPPLRELLASDFAGGSPLKLPTEGGIADSEKIVADLKTELAKPQQTH
jgi:hypothetical protein